MFSFFSCGWLSVVLVIHGWRMVEIKKCLDRATGVSNVCLPVRLVLKLLRILNFHKKRGRTREMRTEDVTPT